MDRDAFQIRHGQDLSDGEIGKFFVDYECMDDNYRVDAIIPPSGISEQFNLNWAARLRNAALKEAEDTLPEDRVIMCGLSYWHVDRPEIDSILRRLNRQVSFILIHPHPAESLNAVLVSLFESYIHYTRTEILEEL